MTSLGWIASSCYARTRNSAWIVAMLFLACAAPLCAQTASTAAPASVEEARGLSIRRASEAKRRTLSLISTEHQSGARAQLTAILGAIPARDLTAADFDGPLADAEASVRLSAVGGLGKLDGAGARTRLERVLGGDPSAGVRMAAAFWLGRPEHARAAATLEVALTRDADPNVRVAAAQALARVGTAGARRGLRRGAGDSDERVRRWAK